MIKITSTNAIMRNVIYALLLGVAANVYFFGFGVIIQIILAIITALAVEALVLTLRKTPIYETLADGSAIITAILLAIAIPTIAPWWLIVLGVSFAIIFAKQIYGGLGNNTFNPAMVGYVFLLIAYPLEMTQWQGEGFLSLADSLGHIFMSLPIDAITSATILDIASIKTTPLQLTMAVVWINIGFLLGGVYLLLRKIIFWHIPIAMLAGIIVGVELLALFGVQTRDIALHLFSGATMLAAFFIATDPVTASTTNNGRLIYGFGIGLLIIIIRELGGYYPDGVAFAILLMNIVAPLLDTYTQPKTLGS